MLLRFCQAYQRVKPLQIGEIWAIPISLRIVLIENLRRLCQGMVSRAELCRRADAIVDSLPADDGMAAVPALRGLASAPLPHAATSKPAFAARRSTILRTGGSSSTTRSSGRAAGFSACAGIAVSPRGGGREENFDAVQCGGP